MRVSSAQYEMVRRAVDAESTATATKIAVEHGVHPPTDDSGWEVVAEFPADGGPAQLVWARGEQVVIDPAGFHSESVPDDAMEIDPEVHARLLRQTQTVEQTGQLAEHVAACGVRPPTQDPGWEVFVDIPPGRGGEERLVWRREESVYIEPADEL
ncbi:MAG: hypothetical protein ACRDXX_13055 [Stackebrandtia sp.]